MPRCRTCNASLDPNAEACQRCGAPVARQDAPSHRNTVLVFFAFFALGLVAYAWLFGLPEKTVRAPRPADAVTAPAVPDPGAVPLPEAVPTVVDAPVAAELEPEAPAPASHDGFPFEATLSDRRGVIVLQSKATMFSRNVAKLA